MSEVWKTFTIEEFKGTESFEVEVYGYITKSGSNSYGSDEPYWEEVEITRIYNPRKCEPVSTRLYKALIKNFEDYFAEGLSNEL